MVRVAIVACSLALAVAALPAVADQPCVGTACSGACAQAADHATAPVSAAACPASCKGQTVAVAADGACACDAATCQQTTTLAEKAAECLESGKSTSKAIRLTLERLPIVGLSLGFSRHQVMDAASGTCQVEAGTCQTAVATQVSGECGASCAATKTVATTAETDGACSCTADCCADQKQEVVTAVPVPGASRVFTVKTQAHQPHDVVVRTAALDVVPGPAVRPLPDIHHRFQLHVVGPSLYMFDPVTGSLFEPGDQGNWAVRASLTDAQR
jgi:hypothetical protein